MLEVAKQSENRWLLLYGRGWSNIPFRLYIILFTAAILHQKKSELIIARASLRNGAQSGVQLSLVTSNYRDVQALQMETTDLSKQYVKL